MYECDYTPVYLFIPASPFITLTYDIHMIVLVTGLLEVELGKEIPGYLIYRT